MATPSETWNKYRMRPLCRLLPALSLFCAAATAVAQEWPVRPLRLIVAEAAGGAPDTAARALASRLAPVLGQKVSVEDIPDTGADVAARARPDGYTYLLASASLLAIDAYLVNVLDYSPEDDFAPVAMIGTAPFALAAIPALSVNSLRELIALAKTEPDKLALANPGRLTLAGMLGALLRNRARIDLRRVAFKGGEDLLAGRTHLIILPVSAIAPAVGRGQLRALAVSSAQRIPEWPGVGTFSETFPGFEFNNWYMLVAPTGTPPQVIRRMNLEANRALLDADIGQILRGVGIYTEGSDTPDKLEAFLGSERQFWFRVVRELKLEP
jgi:tripartite-type tricarboxylate transporter receptor subunit TctC